MHMYDVGDRSKLRPLASLHSFHTFGFVQPRDILRFVQRSRQFLGCSAPRGKSLQLLMHASIYHVPGGYKYGNPAFQVGRVSKRQHSIVTGSARLEPMSDCTANCRPVLSSEREPHRNQTATFRRQPSGRKSQVTSP
jgi:predicted nucleic acid-binding Zn ribbon protein